MKQPLALSVDDSVSSFHLALDYFSFAIRSAVSGSIHRSRHGIDDFALSNAIAHLSFDKMCRSFRNLDLVIEHPQTVTLRMLDLIPSPDLVTRDEIPACNFATFRRDNCVFTILIDNIVAGFLLTDVKRICRRVWRYPNIMLFDDNWNLVGILNCREGPSRAFFQSEEGP